MEAEQEPLKKFSDSSDFHNPNWLVWKGIPPPKTHSIFPWDRQTLPYGDY